MWGREIPRAPKSHNNVESTFFNTIHLLPKDLMFEHGGAKLVSCPGRHLTSVRLCQQVRATDMSHKDCAKIRSEGRSIKDAM